MQLLKESQVPWFEHTLGSVPLIPKHSGNEQVNPEYPVLQEQLLNEIHVPLLEQTFGDVPLTP